MNILLVGDGDTRYGAPHSLLHMAIELNKLKDNNITVILNQESDISKELKKNGCKVEIVHYMPYYQGFPTKIWIFPIKYVLRGLQYYLGRTREISLTRAIMAIGKFDIVHSNSSREDFAAILAEHYNIPLVWHIREFGDRDYKCYSYRSNYIEFMNRTASKFIAISDAVRLHWIAKGIDAQKIVTVYNGVEKTDYKRREDNQKIRSDIRIVMAGSVQETKGQLQAVQAVIRVIRANPSRKITFDIIGGGDMMYIKKIERLLRNENLRNNVRLLGYKTKVSDLLPSYDIGLMCSKDEGFGRVTAEYMMAGLPVIASDTGANKELIRDEIDGLFYSYGNINSLATKIQYIIDNMEQFGGLKTHEYAARRFSAEENARNVYRIYKELV